MKLEDVSVRDLLASLFRYEELYRVPSARLADAFTRNGVLEETADFQEWSELYAEYQLCVAGEPLAE